MADLDQKTLESLLDERFEKQARMIKAGFDNTASKDDIKRLEKEIKEIKDELKAVSAKLTAHLELSDKRYLELKYKNSVVVKWVKQIADKTGVEIDLAELEKF